MKNAKDAKVGAQSVIPNLWEKTAPTEPKGHGTIKLYWLIGELLGHSFMNATSDLPFLMLPKEPGPTASIEQNGVDLKFAPSTLILTSGGNAR